MSRLRAWPLLAVGALAACVGGSTAPKPVVIVPTATPPLPPAPVCTAAPLPEADPDAAQRDDDTISPRETPWSEDPKVAMCEVTTKTLVSATAAVLALAAPPAGTRASTPWDHRTAPIGLDRVRRRFSLSATEVAQLTRDGLVVPARISQGDWADSLHDVWQSELPLWVSADAVLHAVYASNDRLMARIEVVKLAPQTDQALNAMHCGLLAAAGTWPRDTLHDVDLYLTVARSLLASAPVASMTGIDAEAHALVAALVKAEGLSGYEVFGRSRKIDFSQYLPRGHYADNPRLQAYFRAAMFLSRFELNVVSRSSRSSADSDAPDPRETPREAIDALAIADLASKTHADADLAAIEKAWRVLAGKREDLAITDLAALRATAKIDALNAPDAFPRLRAAIGSQFPRTARLHPMPEGSTDLPVIATLFGARVTPDTFATRPLVHSETPERHLIGPLDFAFMLGHDRAKTYLKDDIANFPPLDKQLDVAREIAARPTTKEDLYGPWLTAIRDLAVKPKGATPAFMQTPAFADLRIAGALAGYAQIRHNNVLTVGQGYDEGGCQIPDAFVDPVPDVYDALIEYATRGKALAALADPDGTMHITPYFERLTQTLTVLSKIARWELSGQPLPAEAKHWLDLVVELRPYGGTGGPPSFTGWWFDLFRLRQEGLSPAELLIDTFTSSYEGKVLYLGVGKPALGIFVVDTGGPPRVMVGPVASSFAHVGPLTTRLTDHDATTVARSAPWEASYTVPAPPIPPLELRGTYPSGSDEKPPKNLTFELRSNKALGPVTIEALDHHRVVYASQKVVVGTAWVKFTFPYVVPHPVAASGDAGTEQVDALRIRVGGAIIERGRPHQVWTDDSPMPIHEVFGGM